LPNLSLAELAGIEKSDLSFRILMLNRPMSDMQGLQPCSCRRGVQYM